MPEFLDNVTELIGNTPLLRLTRFSQAHGCVTPILAKLEGMNPGGSVKDRTMLGILRDALRQGRLKQGDMVLEVSAGNQGVSLASFCRRPFPTRATPRSTGRPPGRRSSGRPALWTILSPA